MRIQNDSLKWKEKEKEREEKKRRIFECEGDNDPTEFWSNFSLK